MHAFTLQPVRKAGGQCLGVRCMTGWAAVLWLAAAAASQDAGAKIPLPSEADRAEAVQAVQEEYADRSNGATNPIQKAALAEEMLEEASQADDSARRFALLQAAGHLAADAGDLPLAVRAVDATAAAFAFDALEAKVALLRRAADAADRVPEQRAQIVRTIVHAFDDAYNADRPDMLPQLVEAALAAAEEEQEEEAAPRHPGAERVLNRGDVHANAAVRYMAFRRWKEARTHAEALLSGSYVGEGHVLIGSCYEAAQRWAKAEEHFREASAHERTLDALYFYYRRTGKGDRDAVAATRRMLNENLHRMTRTHVCVLFQLDRRFRHVLPVAGDSFVHTDAPWHGLHAMLIAAELNDVGRRDEALERLLFLRSRRAREQPGEPPHRLLELASLLERDLRDGGTGAIDPAHLAKLFRKTDVAHWGDMHYFTGKYLELHGKPELAVEYWKKCMAHYAITSLNRTLAGAELVRHGVEPETYRKLVLHGLPDGRVVVAEAAPEPVLLLDDTEPVPHVEARPLGPDSPVVVVLPPALPGRVPAPTRDAAQLVCDLLAEQLRATGTARVVSRAQLDRVLKERKLAADLAGPMLSYDALVRLEVEPEGGAPQAHLSLVDLSTGNPLAQESFDWPLGRAGVARMVLACRVGLDEAPKRLEGKVKVRLLGIEAAGLHARLRPLGRRARKVFAASIDRSDRLLLVQNLEAASSREEALLLAMGMSRLPGARQFSPHADATIEFRLAETDPLGKTFDQTELEFGVRLRRGAEYEGDWTDHSGPVKDFDRLIAEAWANVAASLSEAAPAAAQDALDAMALRRKQAEAEYRAAMAIEGSFASAKPARAKLPHLDAALRLDPDHEGAAYEAFYQRFRIVQATANEPPDPESIHQALSAAVGYLRRFHDNPQRRLQVGYYSHFVVYHSPARPWASADVLVEVTPELRKLLRLVREIVEHSVSGDIRGYVWQRHTASMLAVAYRGMRASGEPAELREAWLENILRLAAGQATQIEKITARQAQYTARKQSRVLASYRHLQTVAAELLHEDGRSGRARQLLTDVRAFFDDPASGVPWSTLRLPIRSYVRRVVATVDPVALPEFNERLKEANQSSRPFSRAITWPRMCFYDPDPQASIRPRYIVAQPVGDADYPAMRPLGEIGGRFYLHVRHRRPIIAYLPLDAQGRPVGREQYRGAYLEWTWDNIQPLALPDGAHPWIGCSAVVGDRLYLGTSNRGLLVFHPDTEQWTAYGAEDGLPSMSVESIAPMDANTLYGTTVGAHFTLDTGSGAVTLLRQSDPEAKDFVPRRMLHVWKNADRWMGLSGGSVWNDLLDARSTGKALPAQYGESMRDGGYWALGGAVSAARIGSRRFFTGYNGLCEFDAAGTIVRCWPSRLDARLLDAARQAAFDVPGYAPVFERAQVVRVADLLVFVAEGALRFQVSAYDPSSDTWYGPIQCTGSGWAERGEPRRYGAVASRHGLWVGGMRGAAFVHLDDLLDAARRSGRAMTTAELQEQLQRRIAAAPPLQRAKMHVRMHRYDLAQPLLDELLADDPNHPDALAVREYMQKRP